MQNGLGNQLLQPGRKQQRKRTAKQNNNDDDPGVPFDANIPLTHVGKKVQRSDAFAVHGHLLEHLQVAAVEAVEVLLRARGKH